MSTKKVTVETANRKCVKCGKGPTDGVTVYRLHGTDNHACMKHGLEITTRSYEVTATLKVVIPDCMTVDDASAQAREEIADAFGITSDWKLAGLTGTEAKKS